MDTNSNLQNDLRVIQFKSLFNYVCVIRVDTGIKTDVKIRNNRLDIFILDRRQKRITLIEIRISSQDSLQILEKKEPRENDIVTKYHKTYQKRLHILMNVEAYISSIV
ncbi:hypothetical protein CWI38_0292p0040 [Hamiltosporidium tvaerminnensis]|uniref:Uncharacterized protein n=1 Tax=Hamiltosporidium tvaerminnensis TaxID=1176355 RepID=A0A4Q9M034_9MICR|nr:hypothetical protein CWI38_0292p0040 [Hamiltosporidium tvaerminnensis]